MTKENIVLFIIVDSMKAFKKKNVIDIWTVNARLYKKAEKHGRELQVVKGMKDLYIDRLLFPNKILKNKYVDVDNRGYNNNITDIKFKSVQSISHYKYGSPAFQKALKEIVNAKRG